jgi:hypothetical protein
MDSSKKVGLVTVTFNSESVLKGFMDSINKLSHENFSLYIIDNASSDNTLTLLKKYQDKRFITIANQSNTGVAAANNQGILMALLDKCDYVLLINNDTEFESNLLEKLIFSLEKNKCDMAVPKIKYWDNKEKIWCAGGFFRRWAAWQSFHYGEGELDQAKYNHERIINYSPTCCMLINSLVFLNIGLMDEKYFVYYDDTDFCFRAWKAGIKMIYVPDINFYHKVSSLTGTNGSDFITKYSTRNFVYYIQKTSGLYAYLWLILYYSVLHIKYLFKLDSHEKFVLKKNSFDAGLKLGK